MNSSRIPKPLPVDWVTATVLREHFNRNNCHEKALNGELIVKVKRSSHPSFPPQGEPFCTHSQIVYYYKDDRTLVAIAHQYLRPDGTIGGSGRPDPKRMILDDRILATRAIVHKKS
jgi:hypothetical protein